MKDKNKLGSHWNDTKYSKNYQLYRRIEAVARQLEERRLRGHQPLKKHVAELYDIAQKTKAMKVK
jgi:hypothetical protein